MEKLIYLNEYAKFFEFSNKGELLHEDKLLKNNNTGRSKNDKYYSQMKRKNNDMLSLKLNEKNSSKKKLNFYKENNNKYKVSKIIHNKNEYVLVSTVPTSSKLHVTTSKGKNKLNHMSNEIMKSFRQNTNNKFTNNTYGKKMCICKKCYMNSIQEQIKERKKRTTVYTLEFNNLINYDHDHILYQDNKTEENKTKEYILIDINNNGYEYNTECNEGVTRNDSEQISRKRSLFPFLNFFFN
ncbi:hypothetical protein MKS88_003270 [Plasmodium brasilianum]|uniref:Uncharacterized protein n=2 Tax=Plasmodium (Plasmodium) TaxID=418103 RepID=A0A1A8WIE9_PLAMA|nr:conserved Plasmodium protein, unknown function [Plasmodium malariae]KAI4837851.1 hypothetical protein MKS88_003270 [Plasmodium brasilianum]SBS91599.1 conserved Plasmodium protein, unknown function [Plasmodium malariae]SCN44946.1 conserved Plasmodium protein, unknown function [Plasmodium malariae]